MLEATGSPSLHWSPRDVALARAVAVRKCRSRARQAAPDITPPARESQRSTRRRWRRARSAAGRRTDRCRWRGVRHLSPFTFIFTTDARLSAHRSPELLNQLKVVWFAVRLPVPER